MVEQTRSARVGEMSSTRVGKLISTRVEKREVQGRRQ
jgi:hypothetical protein